MLCVALRNVPLAKVGLFEEFVGLGKHIKWFSSVVSQHSDNRSSSSVQNGSVIKDNLCPYQNTSNFRNVVSYLIVVDQLTVDSFQHQFFVEFDSVLNGNFTLIQANRFCRHTQLDYFIDFLQAFSDSDKLTWSKNIQGSFLRYYL